MVKALGAQRESDGVVVPLIGVQHNPPGDARRFSSSDQLVRFAGLDVTVYSSDRKRAPGHLSRQGSPELRWAAFEAAKCAARRGSPDYAYYRGLAAKHDSHNGKGLRGNNTRI